MLPVSLTTFLMLLTNRWDPV